MLFRSAQFHTLTRWMCKEFLAQQAEIAEVYFCPFHPEFGIGHYKQASSFRKPGPGMILQALREHAVNPHASILVGDNASDIEAGLAAGIGCNILYAPTENAAHLPNTLSVKCLTDVKKYLTRAEA